MIFFDEKNHNILVLLEKAPNQDDGGFCCINRRSAQMHAFLKINNPKTLSKKNTLNKIGRQETPTNFFPPNSLQKQVSYFEKFHHVVKKFLRISHIHKYLLHIHTYGPQNSKCKVKTVHKAPIFIIHTKNCRTSSHITK